MTSTVYAASLIRESASNDTIVHVTSGDCYSAGCEFDALQGALLVECEDDVEANGVREFWGATEDGHEWRVHVQGVV